jgi:uncharacterized protein YndB with AHSA1/START domain
VKRDIRWRVHLSVPPAQVYGYIGTDAGRARWWVERSHETDGLIELDFADGQSLIAPILARRPPALYALRWFDGAELRFELRPDSDGGTDLDLSEFDVGDARWSSAHAGWVASLLALKAACEHRIDLRNHDPARGWDAGYVDG